MTQLSLESATIENKECVFILGKFIFLLIELAVRNADGGGDVALDVFWFIGP